MSFEFWEVVFRKIQAASKQTVTNEAANGEMKVGPRIWTSSCSDNPHRDTFQMDDCFLLRQWGIETARDFSVPQHEDSWGQRLFTRCHDSLAADKRSDVLEVSDAGWPSHANECPNGIGMDGG